MSQEEDFNASLAHLVLSCVAARGIGGFYGRHFTITGMHTNFFVHGILGFMHYQSSMFKNDYAPTYSISYKATRYLALPCLNADLRAGNHGLSLLHLLSGLIPFVMSLQGEENVQLANLVLTLNILSLCQYSVEHESEWGWMTAGAALFAYFVSPNMGAKIVYPLGLALMEYCAYRISRPSVDVAVGGGVPGRRR